MNQEQQASLEALLSGNRSWMAAQQRIQLEALRYYARRILSVCDETTASNLPEQIASFEAINAILQKEVAKLKEASHEPPIPA